MLKVERENVQQLHGAVVIVCDTSADLHSLGPPWWVFVHIWLFCMMIEEVERMQVFACIITCTCTSASVFGFFCGCHRHPEVSSRTRTAVFTGFFRFFFFLLLVSQMICPRSDLLALLGSFHEAQRGPMWSVHSLGVQHQCDMCERTISCQSGQLPRLLPLHIGWHKGWQQWRPSEQSAQYMCKDTTS